MLNSEVLSCFPGIIMSIRLFFSIGFQVFQCVIIPSSESSALDELVELLMTDGF